MKESCIVLFSGGLDSRLAVKIMKERGFGIIAIFFRLPFEKKTEKEFSNFLKGQRVKFKVIDCTKGKQLQEYLKILRKAKYGRGVGMNPCIDCRIFMLRKAREFADKKKIKFIVTGEVSGQRPMSQNKQSLELTEKKSGLEGRLIRPLMERGMQGRRREKQISLAKDFGIKYPYPAGGCLLCERDFKRRFKFLLERGFNNKELQLVNMGRHFLIDGKWVVLGRNKQENALITRLFRKKIIGPFKDAPSAVILDKPNKKLLNKIKELIDAYSKKGSLEERKKFDKEKL